MGMLSNVSHAGMDCHRTFSRLTCRDVQNRIVHRQRLEHADGEKLRKQFERLPTGTPVIIEGTFGWGWMADLLSEAKLQPHLANCRKVEQWRKTRGLAKTNKLDADLLSGLWPREPQETQEGRWWEVWLAPQSVRDQRELLRYRMALVRTQMATKLRIHALLHRHGILNPYSDLFGAAGRKFLQEQLEAEKPLRAAARLTLAGHLRLLQQLRQQIAQVTRELRRQVRRDPAAGRWDTMPGVGWILAYTIQAEIGDLGRFKSDDRLARYALLAPLADDSGEETEDTPINRHVGHAGRRTLKYAFIEAAHGAVRKSPRLRGVFDRRTDKGKRDKNRGYIAVARHLCHIGYACLRKGVNYMEQRPPRPGERSPVPSTARQDSCPELGQPEHPMVRPSKSRQHLCPGARPRSAVK
jgi:transposase